VSHGSQVVVAMTGLKKRFKTAKAKEPAIKHNEGQVSEGSLAECWQSENCWCSIVMKTITNQLRQKTLA